LTRCIIIGKTNVGKTLFTINFAEFLGLKKINVVLEYHDGSQHSRSYTIREARTYLTDPSPHKTLCLQIVTVNIPKGKGKKKIKLIDTSGLIDGIHPDENIRKAISQTLANVRTADLILHIVDAAVIPNNGVVESLGEIDYQIAQFGQMKYGYALLANKMDLPEAERGLDKLRDEFKGLYIIPVSALYKQGFNEVKKFVSRNI